MLSVEAPLLRPLPPRGLLLLLWLLRSSSEERQSRTGRRLTFSTPAASWAVPAFCRQDGGPEVVGTVGRTGSLQFRSCRRRSSGWEQRRFRQAPRLAWEGPEPLQRGLSGGVSWSQLLPALLPAAPLLGGRPGKAQSLPPPLLASRRYSRREGRPWGPLWETPSCLLSWGS